MSIRVAAIGFDHPHIYNILKALTDAGAQVVSFWDSDAERCAHFAGLYPKAQQARSVEEILEDATIQLVASAAIPSERPALGIRVMQHGKDYTCAKPGFTTLEQLAEARRVQGETRRIYAVHFGERLDNPSTVKAAELARSGAIGKVVQTVGFGPHRFLGHVVPRPPWTKDPQFYGGILNDLASHQIDQFLYITQSSSAEIVQSQVGNVHHRQFPLFEDFGDLTIRSTQATGYVRVDWLNPRGLNTWGDVRLFVLGTEGYIELRKNVDIAGREGTNHLFMVDQQQTQYVDCADVVLPYGAQLIADVLHRTETAMSQAHCFLASELTLIAQAQAKWHDFSD
ncbi:MAG: Gfo/Idh/MocA family oxidoreductase [Chloroflexota bacterium]